MYGLNIVFVSIRYFYIESSIGSFYRRSVRMIYIVGVNRSNFLVLYLYVLWDIVMYEYGYYV